MYTSAGQAILFRMILHALFLSSATAAPMALDPARPPIRVGEQDGRSVYRFGPQAVWATEPAVIVRSALQPSPEARWLGGPFWRLPSGDPVGEALRWRAEGVLAFPDVVIPRERRDFDDPSYGGQWYLQELEMEALYAVSLGAPGVRVAVIDSGIDIHHPDLEAAVDDPYDAWSDDDDPSPDPGAFCTDGSDAICDEHGTAVSGIVLARADNGAGIVGMCPGCTLIPIKLLGDGPGRGISADVAAFEHAIAADAAVINNSWGFTEPTPVPDLLAEVIHRAATEPRGGLGALVVFAAGNDDRALDDGELTGLPDVLCVSATDSYGRPTNYTNYGGSVGLAAPSATVTIAPGGAVITTFGGTSAAAPVASGLAGWALSLDPDLSAEALHALLIDTAVPSPLVVPDASGHDDYYGYGLLSATGVLDALTADNAGGDKDLEEPAACACAATAPGPQQAAQAGIVALTGLLVMRRRTLRR